MTEPLVSDAEVFANLQLNSGEFKADADRAYLVIGVTNTPDQFGVSTRLYYHSLKDDEKLGSPAQQLAKGEFALFGAMAIRQWLSETLPAFNSHLAGIVSIAEKLGMEKLQKILDESENAQEFMQNIKDAL